ncbi:Uncharacterised protein [Legionella lansingensis]|uniref:J domain-containing protein n=1 Tax=Legionella lansingensis TaxID=45067 RepID=A0A0W0VXN1_9GAMM|nr:hypothetical protein [Legionella lansingensis]KTD24787.1 hypothetical protein Llan_0349 [Legionella lansingensis]SNV48958.1 Uncharacterised protein [Legionella lansingensis]
MNFEKDLEELIAVYAIYDKELNIYKDKKSLGIEEKQKIEAMLIALISQYLSQDGLEDKDRITHHSKKLQRFFHPDKYLTSSPENKWLQDTLYPTETSKGGTCFNLVKLCEKKLKNPELPEFHLENITTMEALITRLERDKEYATTYTERALLESILTMLRSAGNYNSQMDDKIPIIWAKRLTQLMPYLTTGYCVSYFLKELALLYAVTFTLTKSGQWFEHSSSTHLQMVGQVMHVFSDTIFAAVTALIARLTELNIFMVRGAINLGIDASGGLYKLLAAPRVPNDATNNSRALILAPQDLFGGLRFTTFELKLLAMGLEEKAKQLKNQWLLGWRAGSIKYAAIKETLQALQRLDSTDVDLSTKLDEAEKIIKELAKNQKVNVNGSGTNKTIKMAQMTLVRLKKPKPAEEERSLIHCDEMISLT